MSIAATTLMSPTFHEGTRGRVRRAMHQIGVRCRFDTERVPAPCWNLPPTSAPSRARCSRPLVAQQVNAFIDQGDGPMAVTMRPSSTDADRQVRTGVVVPVVRVEGLRIVIVLRGDADVSARSVLCEVLSRVIGVGAGDVVVDLAEVNFIDTGFARVLATGQQLLARSDRRLTVRSPSRLAFKVLEMFGMTDLIEGRVGAKQ